MMEGNKVGQAQRAGPQNHSDIISEKAVQAHYDFSPRNLSAFPLLEKKKLKKKKKKPSYTCRVLSAKFCDNNYKPSKVYDAPLSSLLLFSGFSSPPAILKPFSFSSDFLISPNSIQIHSPRFFPSFLHLLLDWNTFIRLRTDKI